MSTCHLLDDILISRLQRNPFDISPSTPTRPACIISISPIKMPVSCMKSPKEVRTPEFRPQRNPGRPSVHFSPGDCANTYHDAYPSSEYDRSPIIVTARRYNVKQTDKPSFGFRLQDVKNIPVLVEDGLSLDYDEGSEMEEDVKDANEGPPELSDDEHDELDVEVLRGLAFALAAQARARSEEFDPKMLLGGRSLTPGPSARTLEVIDDNGEAVENTTDDEDDEDRMPGNRYLPPLASTKCDACDESDSDVDVEEVDIAMEELKSARLSGNLLLERKIPEDYLKKMEQRRKNRPKYDPATLSIDQE